MLIPLRDRRDRPLSFPDLLDYFGVVADGVVVCKSELLLAGWEYRGPDMDSASGAELDDLADRLNTILARFDEGWMLHCDAVRSTTSDYSPPGAFPDATTWLIDEERRAAYRAEGTHCETRTYLVVSYTRPQLQTRALGQLLGVESEPVSAQWPSSRDIATFQVRLRDIEDALGFYVRLRRLARRDVIGPTGEIVRSDDLLLTHLNRCIRGAEYPLSVRHKHVPLDVVLGGDDFYAGIKPRIGATHIRVVDLYGFPAQTFPGVADILHRYNLRYRWSHRFIALSKDAAERELEKKRGQWAQQRFSFANLARQQVGEQATHVNLDAETMTDDAVVALARGSRGEERFGFYSSNIVLMDSDEAALDEMARTVVKLINNAGFNCRIEDINAVEAYLGTLPGHGAPNVRRNLIHTRNLAHLLPISNLWPGLPVNPSDKYPPASPPLAFVSASGSTPFRLNLHVEDVGHFLVTGPTGAGKSTLLAFLAAQHFRYPGASVFAFDKGGSILALALAAGGCHHDLSMQAEESGAAPLHFQPLAGIDRASERVWAEDWISTLVALHDLQMTPPRRVALHRAIELAAALEPRMRTMTNLQAKVQDEALREALLPYTLVGSESGQLFDGDRDGLGSDDFSGFHVFEIGDLLQMDTKFATPLILYICHRIERSLRGQPALIIMDEAWALFSHELFCEQIRTWLKTMRKANAAVGFATTSISDVLRSPIADVVVDNCPTKIFLPNPEARTPESLPSYQRMGLSPRQVALLTYAQPKRDYYYTSPLGRRIFSLELGPVQRAFLCAGDRDSQARVRALAASHPNVWPMQWLYDRHIPAEWSDLWFSRLTQLVSTQTGAA